MHKAQAFLTLQATEILPERPLAKVDDPRLILRESQGGNFSSANPGDQQWKLVAEIFAP